MRDAAHADARSGSSAVASAALRRLDDLVRFARATPGPGAPVK
jgi:hypothetical protein